MYDIIKNAEIPVNKRRGSGRTPKYPFAKMKKGDGFDAPRDLGKHKGGDRRQRNVSCAASCYVKNHNPNAKFTVRLLNKDTVRCVRIA